MASSIEYQNPLTIEGALQLWQQLLPDKSSSTVDCYLRDVRQIADVLGSQLGRIATLQDVIVMDEAHLNHLVEVWGHDAPATIRRRLVSLRRFARMLAASLGLSGPLLHCAFPVIDVAPTMPANPQDLSDLVVDLEGRQDWEAARDRAIITLIAEHALSTGEIHHLDRSHVLANVVMVTSPRGGLRFVTLNKASADALEAHLEEIPSQALGDGPLWRNRNGERLSTRSIQIMLRRRRRAVELPNHVVAGAFRKRRILELAASGMTIDAIAAEVGIGKSAVLAHLPGS